MKNKEKKGTEKRPIYKKWWFWVIIVILISAIFSSLGSNDDMIPDTSQNPGQSEAANNSQTSEDSSDNFVEEGNLSDNKPSKENPSDKFVEEGKLYDNAEVKDIMNGIRTEKIGEYSIIRANSSDVTIESLADWYFNYVTKNDFNWCMIIYTDKTDNSGVYAIKGMVEKDVIFEQDKYGDYMLGDSPNSTLYTPTDEKTLKEF